MNAYNVYLRGKLIDTVFDNETDKEEVKKSLVNHDGYDARITVRKQRGSGKRITKPLTKQRRERLFIERYILDCICSDGYEQDPKTDIGKVEFAYNTFLSEKGWEVERVGRNKAFENWLQGLCSALPIAFYNCDIIELSKKQGVLPTNPTEKEEDVIIERYWRYMTIRFFELYRKLTGKEAN